MEVIFQSFSEELKNSPWMLNEITQNLLKQAAKQHHHFNKLLPASFIQILLMHYNPELLKGTNIDAQKYLLSINSLRSILTANFSQLSENKMFSAVIMNYAQSLCSIIQKQRQQSKNQSSNSLRFVARGYFLSEIIIKLLQRTHTFIPEYFRFIKISIELAKDKLERFSQHMTQKQYKKLVKCQQNSTIPKIIYEACLKKSWKRSTLVILIKSLSDQFQRYLRTCGLSNQILSLSISKEISNLFDSFKASLSQEEQICLKGLSIELNVDENEALYLQQPLKVKQLTPRFYDEEKAAEISKLRRKKQKLTKRLENDLRKSVIVKQQEAQVIEDVRRQKGTRQRKKQSLIIEKQTVQVKKYNRQIKKIKQIKKVGKPSKIGKRPNIRGNKK